MGTVRWGSALAGATLPHLRARSTSASRAVHLDPSTRLGLMHVGAPVPRWAAGQPGSLSTPPVCRTCREGAPLVDKQCPQERVSLWSLRCEFTTACFLYT